MSIVHSIASFYGFDVRYEYAAEQALHTLRVVFCRPATELLQN
jgi:hypothetical protein